MKNTFKTSLLWSAAAITALPLGVSVGVMPTPASAQQMAIEEIIVTTRKREENLMEIPVAITAISAAQLDNYGLSNLEDIAKIVPGLTFDRSVSQNDYRPAIRGLQAEQGRTSVGLLIDGIDITSENLQVAGGGSLARLSLVDVERIEVVKGPQAALYGRSAFGGAVNYITKRPSLTESDAKGSFEVHSESGFELKASGGAPIVEDTFGVRVNAYYFDERGSYKNTFSDEFVGGGDGYGVSAAFQAQVTENLSLYGRVEYSDESYDPQAAFVINGNTDVQLDANAQTVLGTPTTRIFTGPLIDSPIRFDIDPRTGEDYRGIDVEYFRATLIADWDLDTVGFTSLTSWVDANDNIFQDNDFVSGSVNGIVTGAFQETERVNDTHQFSQEVRIFSQGESNLQWLVGGLYWEEEVDQFGSNDTGLAFLGPITDADVAAFYASRDGEGRGVARDTYHKSAFAWAEYAITDQWFASAEVRYTEETIDYSLDFDPQFDFFFGVGSLANIGLPPFFVSFGAVTGTDFERIKETYTIPKFALRYQASDDVNLYASVGKGIKPSGFQSGAIFELNIPYERETLWSYEIGAKTTLLDGALAFNTAAFYQDYSDQQVSSQIFNEDSQQLQPVIENAGKSTIWGLEFDANWRATEELTLSGSYVYTNAEFDSFQVVSTSASRIGESGCATIIAPNTDPACLLVKDGNKPADLPTHQLTLNGNYTAELNGDWDWFVDGSVRHTSKRFLSTANVATQPSYWRVDAQVGVISDQIRAAIFADNLLDDDTVIDGNLYVDFFNGFAPSGFGYRPDPLTVGLRVNFTM